MKISFLGDISLNDKYVEYYNQGINPFSEVETILHKSDFVVGNLECMAKGDNGENLLKQPRLTTTVETLNYLKNINLSVACLAQNHIYDHLKDGFKKTTDFLKTNNIRYLGAGYSIDQAKEPLTISKEGISVGILNYVTEDTNPNMPPEAKIYLNLFNLESCIKDIQALKGKVNHIVLSLHWGGRVEGGMFPDWDQPKIARKLIDAGADLIIGHHSHTLQPFEVYKGKYIFYSLGNFCFAGYWFKNEFNPMPRRRMLSSIIGIKFEKTTYSISPTFYLNEINEFVYLNAYNRVIGFRNIIFKFLKSNKIFWGLYFFHFKVILPFILFFQRGDLSFFVKINRVFIYIRKKLS